MLGALVCSSVSTPLIRHCLPLVLRVCVITRGQTAFYGLLWLSSWIGQFPVFCLSASASFYTLCSSRCHRVGMNCTCASMCSASLALTPDNISKKNNSTCQLWWQFHAAFFEGHSTVCIKISELRMRTVTSNRFNSVTFVETTYLNTDMWKSESSQSSVG